MSADPVEFEAYAKSLGADLAQHPELHRLVLEGFHAPVPAGWAVQISDSGELFFVNDRSGACLNEHPLDHVYRQRVQDELARLRKSDAVTATEAASGPSMAEVLHLAATAAMHPEDPSCRLPDDLVSAAFGDDDGAAVAAPPRTRPVFDVPVPADSDSDSSSAPPPESACEAAPLPPTEDTRPVTARGGVREAAVVCADVEPVDGVPDAAVPAAKPAPTVEVPSEFLCPIMADIMVDPVVAMDGFSYERGAIECWLKDHDTSPCTNEVLPARHVVPNTTLRNFIRDFVAKHGLNLAH